MYKVSMVDPYDEKTKIEVSGKKEDVAEGTTEDTPEEIADKNDTDMQLEEENDITKLLNLDSDSAFEDDDDALDTFDFI